MTVLDRLPLEQIGADARRIRIRPGRALLTVLAALFFALGWSAGKVASGIWLAVSWSAAAVRVGWRQGREGVSRGAA